MTSDPGPPGTTGSTGDDGLEPYLALAREIRRDVERIVADDDAAIASVAEVIDRYPTAERERVVRAVFDRLGPTDQWEILARVFDDAELRRILADEHAAATARARREGEHHALLERCRAAGEIDLRWLPAGATLALGLFREPEVAAAVRRGAESTTTVRRLVLRAEDDGWARVVEDVFDPDRGYFLTTDYDHTAWHAERLESHARVQAGSLLEGGRFEPVLVPGARVDVVSEQGPIRGRLHLGFAMLADDDVFGA